MQAGGLGEASLQARWVQARLLTREACPPGLLARPRRPCHGECPRGLHRADGGAAARGTAELGKAGELSRAEPANAEGRLEE